MLNDNIKTVRKNRGFTQEDLATRLNVTRQTVSKWEKGYSVPDAELLSRMAEILEVPVTELLGEPSQLSSDPDPIVEQLARLNEQLVIKNRRAARIWKTIGITLAVVVVLWIAIAILFGADYSAGPKSATGTVEWTCTVDGETYICGMEYNKNYRIVAVWSPEYLEEQIGFTDFSDVRDAQNALYEWASAHGSTVEVTTQSGLALPERVS